MTNLAAIGPLIAAGREAEVFEYGAMVVKLYRAGIPKRSAFREAAVLAILEELDLPTPRTEGVCRVADRWGLVMSRASGRPFAEMLDDDPDGKDRCFEDMARLHLAIHRHPASLFPSQKARLEAGIANAVQLPAPRRGALLDRLARMPEGDRLCHGDFHPFNVIGVIGEGVVIDWLNATCGSPLADVCRSFVLLSSISSNWASAYIDTYAGLSGEPRDRILAWLPFVAAARLAEGVPDEAAHLIEMIGQG